MLRHVVLFNWTPEATGEQKERVAAELGRLPALIPSLRAYQFGTSAGLNPGAYDFGVVADFDDVEGYLAYRDNPEHRAIIDTFITPIVAQRAATQYEF
jgi:hypothetical protein